MSENKFKVGEWYRCVRGHLTPEARWLRVVSLEHGSFRAHWYSDKGEMYGTSTWTTTLSRGEDFVPETPPFPDKIEPIVGRWYKARMGGYVWLLKSWNGKKYEGEKQDGEAVYAHGLDTFWRLNDGPVEAPTAAVKPAPARMPVAGKWYQASRQYGSRSIYLVTKVNATQWWGRHNGEADREWGPYAIIGDFDYNQYVEIPAPRGGVAADPAAPVLRCYGCNKAGEFPERMLFSHSIRAHGLEGKNVVKQRMCDVCYLQRERKQTYHSHGGQYPWLDKAPAGCLQVSVDACQAAVAQARNPRGPADPTRDADLVRSYPRRAVR